MAFTVRRSNYYYMSIKDEPGEGHRVLNSFAGLGVNLLAFTAIPLGPTRTQFALFPDDEGKLRHAAEQAGAPLDGPHPALLVQGDDELGVLANIHALLHQADVDVYASTAVTDGRGSFGYILYVQPGQYDRAAAALDI
ncbi:MAG: hypothetical protein QNJ90_01800 [Planctomycetota bacterium]|nr:hypothetical protein [Planctomycetota bacterium]